MENICSMFTMVKFTIHKNKYADTKSTCIHFADYSNKIKSKNNVLTVQINSSFQLCSRILRDRVTQVEDSAGTPELKPLFLIFYYILGFLIKILFEEGKKKVKKGSAANINFQSTDIKKLYLSIFYRSFIKTISPNHLYLEKLKPLSISAKFYFLIF